MANTICIHVRTYVRTVYYVGLFCMHVGLLTSMAEFWGKVASTFSDDEFVIGYEIINEPWAGTYMNN